MNAHAPFSATDFAPALRQRQWAESSRQFVRCRRVIDETHDVKTFVFSAASGHMFSFSAGQYLVLNLTIDGARVTRPYSVSSPPTRPLDLQITVKRVKGGLVSNWLHDNLRPGHNIEIEGPVGRFNFDDLPSEKPLFLSGGSGITPVMSMLRALTDRASGHDIRFIHCARTADDIAFRSELEALAARFSNVDVSFICSQEGSAWQALSVASTAPCSCGWLRTFTSARLTFAAPSRLCRRFGPVSRGSASHPPSITRKVSAAPWAIPWLLNRLPLARLVSVSPGLAWSTCVRLERLCSMRRAIAASTSLPHASRAFAEPVGRSSSQVTS
ncbi:MAG: hypothetical protein E5Y85_07280 [Mesorhizobium sp.]|nr:FAD-binding oxidoreductase [Mesorhizobium sp.]TIL34903.1 MAG: hypothetical protein E5Y85_07280 [Mesorhizobium sp.]